MIRFSNLSEIDRLYARRGGLNYGEGVTQMEHALQCATLAERQGAEPSLVAAALLHDVGHLFAAEEAALFLDDRHETSGALVLKDLFDEAVWGPIALHVAAKRYLCFREPGYFATLSPASQASLMLQGGPFDAAKSSSFEHRPYWRAAVALRKFDDGGKRETLSGRTFAEFLPLLRDLSTGRINF